MHDVQVAARTRNIKDIEEPYKKLRPTRDLFEYFRQYTRENPATVALACIGIGIVLGWRLKPW